MTDPKATFLKDWIGNVEKNMTLLSDGSKLMVQKMTKSKVCSPPRRLAASPPHRVAQIKNTTFAESLKRIAETEVGRTTADSLSVSAALAAVALVSAPSHRPSPLPRAPRTSSSSSRTSGKR
jgi:hypothetical protein